MKSGEENKINEEVNFEPLIAAFISMFRGIGRFFRIIAHVVSNQYIRVLGYTSVFALIGLVFYFFGPKEYDTGLTLYSKIIDNKTSEIAVSKLQTLVEDESYGNLAEQLQIGYDTAEKITDIVYTNLNGTEISTDDTVINGQPFTILLTLETNNNPAVYQQALVAFLSNQNYVVEEYHQRKSILRDQIDNLNTQLLRIDSLQELVANSIAPRSKGQGIVFGEPIDPSKITQQREDLYNQSLYLKKELAVLESYKVVSGIIMSEKPSFPRLRHVAGVAALGLLLSLILGYGRARKELK